DACSHGTPPALQHLSDGRSDPAVLYDGGRRSRRALRSSRDNGGSPDYRGRLRAGPSSHALCAPGGHRLSFLSRGGIEDHLRFASLSKLRGATPGGGAPASNSRVVSAANLRGALSHRRGRRFTNVSVLRVRVACKWASRDPGGQLGALRKFRL